MKTILKYMSVLTVLAGTLFSTGCKKIIEIPDNAAGQIVTSQVFSDSLSAINGVVGIYSANFYNIGVLSGYISIKPAMTADELIGSYEDDFNNNDLTAGDGANASGSAGSLWSGFYGATTIYQANACIEGLKASVSLSPTLKNQLLGESEVVRALCYFNLVNLFGPVPLAVTTDVNTNVKLPRASQDAVYTQIIEDLNDAVSKLNNNYPSSGRARPNKHVAEALLSRVYLYKQQWSQAEATATAVIGSIGYSLPALDDVFLQGSQEAIWQVAGSLNYPNLTTEATVLLPYDPSIIPDYYLHPALLNAFENTDQRKSHWLSANTVDGTSYYFPYKYKNNYGVTINGDEGYMILRLAEQYLIRAEARAQLNNLSGAREDLKKIRDRAGLTNTDYTSASYATKEALLIAIRHERQVELFCEWGHRWFDLKRSGTINIVLGAEKSNWPDDGHAALYPIPLDQLKMNPTWIQNPGY